MPPNATPIQPKTTYSIFLSFITHLQSLFLFGSLLPNFHFQYMAHSHHQVAEYHPRSRKTHDCADFFSHFNANLLIGVLIAVYLTIRAKCLCLHKRAFVAPLPCVCIEGCTFRAEAVFPAMLSPAVKCNHLRHHSLFPFPLCIDILMHQLTLPPVRERSSTDARFRVGIPRHPPASA